jgi:hypothetical protein
VSGASWSQQVLCEVIFVTHLLYCFFSFLLYVVIVAYSEVADMKNTTKERSCVSSAGAGHFIMEHLLPEEKWKEGGEGKYGHVSCHFLFIPYEVSSLFTLRLTWRSLDMWVNALLAME